MRRLACTALLWATAAIAQDRPPTTPSRDVDVTYRATIGAQPVEQRSRYRAGDGAMRLDTPSPGVYMIMDPRAKTMAMVSDRDRGVVDMPLQGTPGLPGLAPGQGYARTGTDTVAGLACTEWDMKDSGGEPTTACFTADGVLLRARHGTQVVVVATRVAYGPHDPAIFTVPPGYNHVAARNQGGAR